MILKVSLLEDKLNGKKGMERDIEGEEVRRTRQGRITNYGQVYNDADVKNCFGKGRNGVWAISQSEQENSHQNYIESCMYLKSLGNLLQFSQSALIW